MTTSAELPSASHIPLASQVGGHSGVQTTEDGSLLIKPALPLELRFYQSSIQDPDFAPLRHFVPKFYGTLSLQGKPNIIDVKLGTVLYDESASPDKVERMIKAARETTTLETGVRLTGFQVYNNETGQAVNTPKAYGKSIKVSQLPEGWARFFPTGGADSQSGLPPTTLLPLLRAIREEVAELKDAFAQVHLRMVGGSVLIIYEADWEKAKKGLELLEQGAFDEELEDDDDDEEEAEKPGPPFVVKLIDFAHTRIVPGEGPDEGVLLGLNTILKLLDGRIGELGGEDQETVVE
ncbi:hypothetical protein ONZ45_g9532 [Pleurotus djamor]|nr:hypothetical protein ONZ45_g9532 [Pleurotus djamor]